MYEFDLSSYFPAPNLDTEGFIALTKAMLLNVPKPTPPLVEHARARLEDSLGEAERALDERVEEQVEGRRLKLFDPFVDAVWSELEHRLSAHTLYLDQALTELDDDDREALALDQRAEQARVAAKLHTKLFGDGLEFLRSPYPQQSTRMAARLQWIANKAAELQLDELVGAELLELLRRCQVHYEAMVVESSNHTGKSAVDLRELRGLLRRRLYAYVGALGGMVDDDDPDSIVRIEAALRPLLVARAYTRRRPGPSEPIDFEAVLERIAEASESEAESEVTDTEASEETLTL